MKKTNLLKEMSWTAFQERVAKTKLAIIPSGACEVYGPHLPLGSDTIVADGLSQLLAERVDAVVGPTVECGESAVLGEFPGTIVIRPESFKMYMRDIVDSMIRWGFTDFVFVNTHLGNVSIISQIIHELQMERSDLRFIQVDYWRFIQSNCEGVIETGPSAHAHASETGTSVIAHLYPDLVDWDRLEDEPQHLFSKYPEIMTYELFSEHTKNGCIGLPSSGSAEKGEKLVARTLDRIMDFLKTEWGYQSK